MSNQNYDDQSIDPELRELLALIQGVPARDPDAAQHGRAQYISEVDTLLAVEKRSVFAWFTGLFTVQRASGSHGVRFAYTALIAVIAVIFVLLSGAGATAYAAKNSLPGDVLYQVKTGLEQAQMQLASDANRQALLHLEFAERRLEEISGLIEEGRFGEIDRVAGQFEYHVQQAIRAMQLVASGNPEQAGALAAQIADALSRYNAMLSAMLDQIPDDVRSAVERAILTSRNAGEGQFGEGNDNENENAISNDGDDLSNANSNQNEDSVGNSNGEDNDNFFGNEDGGNEDDGNENTGNENHNSNQNLNHNQNMNQNDNDSGNDNDHENGNDDPNNSNNNDHHDTNDNGNGNENDGSGGGGGNDNGGD